MTPLFLLMYVIFPVLDFYSSNTKNNTENEQAMRAKDRRFLIPVYFFIFAYWANVYATFDYLASVFDNCSYLRCSRAIFMVWVISGTDVILGHELGHRKNCTHRFFGYTLYLRFLNTSFIITHNKGHHKWVATPQDPASAVKGQNVFHFIAHSIPHSFLQGWKIEVERIEKK